MSDEVSGIQFNISKIIILENMLYSERYVNHDDKVLIEKKERIVLIRN